MIRVLVGASRAGRTKHIQKLVAKGPVVLVTVDQSYQLLRETHPASRNLHYIDATGTGYTGLAFLPDATFIEGPSFVELIGLRAMQQQRRMGATIVFDNLHQLEFINQGAAKEFLHSFVMQARTHEVDVDFFAAAPEAPEWASAHADEVVKL